MNGDLPLVIFCSLVRDAGLSLALTICELISQLCAERQEKVYFADCGMPIAECGISKKCILRNFTCGTFRKLHLKVFPHSAKFKSNQIINFA